MILIKVAFLPVNVSPFKIFLGKMPTDTTLASRLRSADPAYIISTKLRAGLKPAA